MSLLAKEFAKELLALLHKDKKPVLTIGGDTFLHLAGREKFSSKFKADMQTELGKLDLLVAYGKVVVVVCYDTYWSESPTMLADM